MKLILTPQAHLKLKYYTELVDGEVSGMAKSTINKNKDIIVKDVIIFKQEISSSSTIIDDEAQAKFLNDLMKKNETLEDWNIWWHSHADMSVFWSTTDDTTIENHVGIQNYLISLVTNKKNEYKARLDIFPKDQSPFKKISFCTFDLEVKVQSNKELEQEKKKLKKIIKEAMNELNKIEAGKENKELKKKCRLEIEQKVKEKTYFVNKYSKQFNKQSKWGWHDDKDEVIDDYAPFDRRIGFNPKYYGK